MAYTAPRGIRNNNPGNLRHGEKWMGLSPGQGDPAFCTFVSPEYGIRALGKVLLNYQARHRLRTVAQIIERFAPPSENNTGVYTRQVATALGVEPDAAVNVRKVLPALVRAIIKHENGAQPYDDVTLTLGVNMALGLA